MEDMKEVGSIIADALTNPDNEEIKDALRARVAALCAKYPLYA
jgi:glycine hydroxymethyltransferase